MLVCQGGFRKYLINKSLAESDRPSLCSSSLAASVSGLVDCFGFLVVKTCAGRQGRYRGKMERTLFEPSRQSVPLACSTIPEEVADQEQAQDRFGINRRAPGLAIKALQPVPPAGSGITGGG